MPSSRSLWLPQKLIEIGCAAAAHAAIDDSQPFLTKAPRLFGVEARALWKGDARPGAEHPMPRQRPPPGRHLQCMPDEARAPRHARTTRDATVGCDLSARNRNDGAPDKFECLVAHGANNTARATPTLR